MEFPDHDSTNYAASAQKPCHEFTSRFPYKGRDEIKVKLFARPFDLAVENSPDDCQMELIELQADMDRMMGYSENSLADFYKHYVSGKYPNLSLYARKMISLVCSTYCCEQFLSRMKLTKTKCQSQLTDEHLTSQ